MKAGEVVSPWHQEAAVPSAESIEVVPAAAAAEPEVWPTEITPAAADIETASLAPLAGEAVEPSAVERRADHAAPAFHGAAAAAADAEPAPNAEAEPGVPFVSGSERRFEDSAPEPKRDSLSHLEPAPEPVAARPNEDVRVVTEKPANPRRGWWQRPAQS